AGTRTKATATVTVNFPRSAALGCSSKSLSSALSRAESSGDVFMGGLQRGVAGGFCVDRGRGCCGLFYPSGAWVDAKGVGRFRPLGVCREFSGGAASPESEETVRHRGWRQHVGEERWFGGRLGRFLCRGSNQDRTVWIA